MKKSNPENQTADLLQAILDEAVDMGAEFVELERVSEGLEIAHRIGNNGIGRLLTDRKQAAALIVLLVQRAGLDDKIRGKLSWEIRGRRHDLTVETYDSFGETCFRIKFASKRKGSPPRDGAGSKRRRFGPRLDR